MGSGSVVLNLTSDGFDYGYGYGYGDGYGNGDGDGCGHGYGHDYGYGYGNGDGHGHGYGTGYGNGYGDGHGADYYWKSLFPVYVGKLPVEAQLRASIATDNKAILALWRSDAKGAACNGGDGGPVYPGLVQEIKGPLEVCTSRALHATYLPHKYSGERLWVVALYGKIQKRDDKLGALKREIIGEIV